jgi:hypothetical protein
VTAISQEKLNLYEGDGQEYSWDQLTVFDGTIDGDWWHSKY